MTPSSPPITSLNSCTPSGSSSATEATFGGISGNAALNLTTTGNVAVALTVGGNDVSTTYSGAISGLGGIEKAGTGLLVLSASNSFTGQIVHTFTLDVTVE